MKDTIIERLYKITSWIYQIGQLTLLMWGTIFAGFIIFGIGPAIMTGDQVIQEMVLHKKIDMKSYLQCFKRNFKEGNQLMLPSIILITIIIFGYSVFMETMLSWVYILLFLYMIQMIFTLNTIKTYYQLSNRESYKVSIKFSQYNIINTIILITINYLLLNFFVIIPGSIPFFSLGLLQMVNTLLMLNFIKFNEKRVEKENGTVVR